MCVLTGYSGTVVIDITCVRSAVWYCGHMEESNPFESQMEESNPFESRTVSLVVYCLRAVFQYDVSMVY